MPFIKLEEYLRVTSGISTKLRGHEVVALIKGCVVYNSLYFFNVNAQVQNWDIIVT